MISRKVAALVCILALAVCLSGCETMAAFSLGKMKSSDLAYLSNVAMDGAEYEMGDDSGVRSMDCWIRRNLW